MQDREYESKAATVHDDKLFGIYLSALLHKHFNEHFNRLRRKTTAATKKSSFADHGGAALKMDRGRSKRSADISPRSKKDQSTPHSINIKIVRNRDSKQRFGEDGTLSTSQKDSKSRLVADKRGSELSVQQKSEGSGVLGDR